MFGLLFVVTSVYWAFGLVGQNVGTSVAFQLGRPEDSRINEITAANEIKTGSVLV